MPGRASCRGSDVALRNEVLRPVLPGHPDGHRGGERRNDVPDHPGVRGVQKSWQRWHRGVHHPDAVRGEDHRNRRGVAFPGSRRRGCYPDAAPEDGERRGVQPPASGLRRDEAHGVPAREQSLRLKRPGRLLRKPAERARRASVRKQRKACPEMPGILQFRARRAQLRRVRGQRPWALRVSSVQAPALLPGRPREPAPRSVRGRLARRGVRVRMRTPSRIRPYRADRSAVLCW